MNRSLLLALPLLAGLFILPAHAQNYPARQVRLVIPFPAAGATDIIGRMVAQKVGDALGISVVVDNKPGAGGAIGTANVGGAAPDGATLLLGTASIFGTNPATQKNLPYDPVRDFAPIVEVATTPYLLLVHPSVPAQTTAAFVAYAKANPGKLNYGSYGLGSSNHLSFELLRQSTGIDVVHVPYKGGAPLIVALLAGEVQSSMDVYATAYPNVKSGKFRLLGAASDKRFSLLPDTPTLAEQGYPVESGTFFVILGPAKLPAPLVQTLNREINRAIATPEVKERLAALGAEPVGGTPEMLAANIDKELQKWAQLVKARNLKFE